MRILHLAFFDKKRHMGPALSVDNLACSQADRGAEVLVYNVRNHDLYHATPGSNVDNVWQVSSPLSLLAYARPDIVHFHSMYIPEFIKVGSVCRRQHVPYVISPRGCLVRRAVWARGWYKKLPALATIFYPFIRGSAALHFLTRAEANVSIRFGVPIVISGNGTTPIEPVGWSARKRLISFVGRLDVEHKGLDRVVRSAGQSASAFRSGGWTIEIHGPDHKGDASRLQRLIKRVGVADLIRIEGPVSGCKKLELLQASSLFVHASRFEGQPQAVLEALASGTPVLLSRGSNMLEDVLSESAGFSFEEVEHRGWGGVLDILSRDNMVEEIGRRGQKLAQRTADWKLKGAESLSIYSELLRSIRNR